MVSFSHLYSEYAAFVARTLRRFGVQSQAIDDARQEVFLVIFRRLPEYEGRSALRTWVFGISKLVANDFRRRARYRVIPSALDPDDLEEDHQRIPYQLLERAERIVVVRRALESIGPRQRRIVSLVDLEERTVPEAAHIAGLKLNTAYSRLRHGRRHFALAMRSIRLRS